MKNVALLLLAIFVWMPAARAQDKPDAEKGGPVALQSKMIEVKECLIVAAKDARLATDRPGVLAAVQPKEGDKVREGEIVARLMDEVAQANLDVANLVADDKVEIEYSTRLNAVDTIEYEKDLDVNRQHKNTVPDLEVQRAKLAMERSSLQIDKAKHEMAVNALKAKQAEAELKTYRITAPFDGTVTAVKKYRGEAVRQGDTILEVVNTAVVRIEGMVKVQDIWNVKVGSPVTVHLNLRKNAADVDVERQIFHGRIGFVDVVANGSSFETRVWAEVANPDNILRPGLWATMSIEPASPDAAVKTSMTSRPASSRRSHP
jgi:membrane fusion protein (multidrug efflux system)